MQPAWLKQAAPRFIQVCDSYIGETAVLSSALRAKVINERGNIAVGVDGDME